jgi:hypothetical protein
MQFRAALRPLFIVVALLGAAARLLGLELIEFRHDSAYWALEATRVLAGGYWPLIGQQVGSVTVPLYNGPFMSYATAAVLGLARALFGSDVPVAMAAFIALCNVAAIGMAYALGARLYSRAAGVVAALLFALAPWLVLYGRMLWPQSFFPLLVPVIVWLLHAHVTRGGALRLFAAGVLLGIAVQLHLSALALVGVTALLALVYAARPASVALLVLGVALGYAPILLYDMQHGWVNLGALSQLSALHAGGDSRVTHLAKLVWNFSNVLSGQGLWVSKLGNDAYLPSPIDVAQGVLFSGAFAAAVLAIVWPNLQRLRESGALLTRLRRFAFADAVVLAFTFAPLVYFAISRSSIQRHYFIFLFPLPFIVIARGAALIARGLTQRLGPQRPYALGALALGAMLLLNTITLVYGARYLATQHGRAEYGTAWADKSAAVRALIAAAPGGFRVDLAQTQEPLPYLYLLRTGAPAAQIDPTALYATDVLAASGTSAPRYRIIELEYHPDADRAGRTIFQSPGIIVVALP